MERTFLDWFATKNGFHSFDEQLDGVADGLADAEERVSAGPVTSALVPLLTTTTLLLNGGHQVVRGIRDERSAARSGNVSAMTGAKNDQVIGVIKILIGVASLTPLADLAAVTKAGATAQAGSAVSAVGSGGGTGSEIVRGFHGAPGDSILGILETKVMIPKNGEVFLSNKLDTFVHGVDLARNAAFSIEVEASTSGVSVLRTAVPGNPQTIVLRSNANIPTNVLRLFTRTRNAEGGFSTDIVEGADAIRDFLAR
jgi:hypothetical protein